jgi:hypothetical protein
MRKRGRRRKPLNDLFSALHFWCPYILEETLMIHSRIHGVSKKENEKSFDPEENFDGQLANSLTFPSAIIARFLEQ